jgi:transcriptional regulator with XRE-family HTH domain
VNVRKLVGANVRRFRKEIGWTQEKLAVRAKLNSQYISRLELGQENVKIETLAKIAKELKIEMSLLFVASPSKSD